jgi:hypothetical protein
MAVNGNYYYRAYAQTANYAGVNDGMLLYWDPAVMSAPIQVLSLAGCQSNARWSSCVYRSRRPVRSRLFARQGRRDCEKQLVSQRCLGQLSAVQLLSLTFAAHACDPVIPALGRDEDGGYAAEAV